MKIKGKMLTLPRLKSWAFLQTFCKDSIADDEIMLKPIIDRK